MEDISVASLFIALAVLLILSGFFSSSETGLIALNRYRLRHLANKGHIGARLAQQLLRKPDRVIGLILFWNNLVNIFASAIATVIGLKLLGELGALVAPFILVFVMLIFSELAPKTIAAYHPESIAFPASRVLNPLLKIMYPVIWLINGAANLLLKPMGIRTQEDILQSLSREELRTLVQEGGEIPYDHQKMLINILDLEHATVEDAMVPRHEVVGIDLEDPWEQILHHLTQSIYTRLPVYRETLDDVVGFLHVRTVIAKLSRGRLSFEELQRSVRKPYFIPEGTPLTRQLLEFQSRERRMGLVVDEYGDIQGLVTLDDILEEIVGEYTQEARDRQRSIRKLEDGNFLVDGTANIRFLNRRMGWSLPTEGARTMNGLLLERLEVIPDGTTSLRLGNHIMTILDIQENTIRRVLVKPDWREREV